MGCNSSSSQINTEWKKANEVLKLKFKEYTDINVTLVSKIVDMRNDAILNKSALLQLLQDYLSNLQECCASLGSKIDETIYLFENIGCLCPPTTTTTEQPVFTTTATEEPTPTTTSEPTPEECNQPTEVDEKGSFYPYIVTKFLGADIGLVTLTFTTYDIPDRFVVEWDTNDVIDTGYHGLAKYQTKLNAAVAVYGDVAGPINTAQTGAVSFIKDNANPWAIVKVYAPLKNTRFEFTLSCPDPFETTTTTTENCWNWILTDIANDGNWTYFDVEYCNGSSEIIALRNGQIRVVCLSNAISFNPLRGTAVNTNLSCNTTTTTTEEDVTTTTEEGTTTTTFPCDLEVEVLDPIPVTTTTTTAEPVTTTTEEPVTTTTEDFVTTTTPEPCLFPPDYDVPATLFMSVVSPPLGIFSGSFVNACNALYGFNNLGYTIAPGYYAVSKRHGFNDYWRVGDFVFDTEECSLVPSGYYIVQVPGQDYRVIYIVDGEIISYPVCSERITWVLISVNDPEDAGQTVYKMGFKNDALPMAYWDNEHELEADGLSWWSEVTCDFPSACWDYSGTDWYMEMDYTLKGSATKVFNPSLGHTGRILISETKYEESDIATILSLATEIGSWSDNGTFDTWEGYFDLSTATENTYVYWVVDWRETEVTTTTTEPFCECLYDSIDIVSDGTQNTIAKTYGTYDGHTQEQYNAQTFSLTGPGTIKSIKVHINRTVGSPEMDVTCALYDTKCYQGNFFPGETLIASSNNTIHLEGEESRWLCFEFNEHLDQYSGTIDPACNGETNRPWSFALILSNFNAPNGLNDGSNYYVFATADDGYAGGTFCFKISPLDIDPWGEPVEEYDLSCVICVDYDS